MSDADGADWPPIPPLPGTICKWTFACRSSATQEIYHPTLGWVDACDKHVEWVRDSGGNPTYYVPPIAAATLRKAQQRKGKR